MHEDIPGFPRQGVLQEGLSSTGQETVNQRQLKTVHLRGKLVNHPRHSLLQPFVV